jgi:hypothetical protein
LRQREIQHQHLHQQRNVAHRLDVDRAQAAHQRVRRQAADAQQGAEDHRQHGRRDRRAHRVDEPGEKGAPERLAAVVVEPALGDLEAGRLGEEVEARAHAASAQHLQRVLDDPVQAGEHGPHEHHLQREAEHRGAPSRGRAHDVHWTGSA